MVEKLKGTQHDVCRLPWATSSHARHPRETAGRQVDIKSAQPVTRSAQGMTSKSMSTNSSSVMSTSPEPIAMTVQNSSKETEPMADDSAASQTATVTRMQSGRYWAVAHRTLQSSSQLYDSLFTVDRTKALAALRCSRHNCLARNVPPTQPNIKW